MSRLNFNKLSANPTLLIIVVFVVSLLSGLAGGWLMAKQQQELAPSLSQQKKIVTRESNLISEIAKTVGPSVVSINVDIRDAATDFFGYSRESLAQAAGTGIILSTDGVIVTNRHVVPTGTTGVSVTLSDGTEFKDVEVLGRTGTNDSLDIAFLKIKDLDGKKLVPASVGDSSNLKVGDAVVAIGNALGQFQNTVTSGIISGYGRSLEAGSSSEGGADSLVDMLQTDAAINQGNSGGPLVNMNGQVIGINTAVAGDGAENIGFAIPINDVKGLITQVLRDGKFSRPYLGVRYIPLTPAVAKQLNLSVDYGAYIPPASAGSSESVIAGSPAAAAGLKEKDIIISVDGKKIDQYTSLTGLLSAHSPGDKVELSVLRDGKTINLNATLGSQPASN